MKAKTMKTKSKNRSSTKAPELSLGAWLSAMGMVFTAFLGGSDEDVLRTVGAAFHLLIQAHIVEKGAALSMLSVLKENMAGARSAVRGLIAPSAPRTTPPSGCFGEMVGRPVKLSDEALILAITELGKANERTAEIAKLANNQLPMLAPVALQALTMVAEWSRAPRA